MNVKERKRQSELMAGRRVEDGGWEGGGGG